MAKIQDLTVKVTLNGALNYDKIAEEVKAAVQREIERVGISANVGESKYRKVTDREARVGDYIKFVKDYADCVADNYYKIVRDCCDGHFYVIDDVDDEYNTWGDDYELYEKVDEEPLKVGDYAKIADHVSHDGYAGAGDIVEIHSNVGGVYDFRVVKVSDKSDYTLFDSCSLVRATDEEVAKAKAKLERKKESEKWAKIGRKSNEFKKGDIVSFEDDFKGVGEVEDIGGGSDAYDLLGVRVHDKDRSYQAPQIKTVKLIAPVEARFDR
ncbi:hypothetical protein [Mesobacillus zeae]|uniref:hypothetical protein n=1 Tax=Mesobacillus zeae TaxID=1917180 RepID=UPI00300A7392